MLSHGYGYFLPVSQSGQLRGILQMLPTQGYGVAKEDALVQGEAHQTFGTAKLFNTRIVPENFGTSGKA